MFNESMADKAARHSAANDIEDFDDGVDFLSEKVLAIARILIPDERLRVAVLVDAFAKAFVDDLYTGEPFDDIELATNMVGELVAGYIIDMDPMLYSDYQGCMEAPEDDTDGVCDTNLCGGDCGCCRYNDDVPRFVFEDGMVRRITPRRVRDD